MVQSTAKLSIEAIAQEVGTFTEITTDYLCSSNVQLTGYAEAEHPGISDSGIARVKPHTNTSAAAVSLIATPFPMSHCLSLSRTGSGTVGHRPRDRQRMLAVTTSTAHFEMI
ncbi:hypothetical protein E2C01_008883 [Portunus trituberculatus]|uniref:Uncharacterized protein n=1 Tax=Portunus trituberculatus TaxID=210409 RepID=A0A5B7D343_PORTR|nr:hypothetical protein [Portunus trituberculatus]